MEREIQIKHAAQVLQKEEKQNGKEMKDEKEMKDILTQEKKENIQVLIIEIIGIEIKSKTDMINIMIQKETEMIVITGTKKEVTKEKKENKHFVKILQEWIKTLR